MPEEPTSGAQQQQHATSGAPQQNASAGNATPQFGGAASDDPNRNSQQSQRTPGAPDRARPPMDVLRDTGQQLKREGMDLAEDVTRKAQDLAEQQKAKAGGYMESMSRAVQAGAEALRRDGLDGSADLVEQVADEIKEAAQALTSRDPRRLLEDVSRLARANPGTFLSVSLLAGFSGARVIKSMAEQKPEQNRGGQNP